MPHNATSYTYQVGYYWKITWESPLTYAQDSEAMHEFQERLKGQLKSVEGNKIVVYFHLQWVTTLGKMRKRFTHASSIDTFSKLEYKDMETLISQMKPTVKTEHRDSLNAEPESTSTTNSSGDKSPPRQEKPKKKPKKGTRVKKNSARKSFGSCKKEENDELVVYIDNKQGPQTTQGPALPPSYKKRKNPYTKKEAENEDEFLLEVIRGTPIPKLISPEKDKIRQKLEQVRAYNARLKSVEKILQKMLNKD